MGAAGHPALGIHPHARFDASRQTQRRPRLCGVAASTRRRLPPTPLSPPTHAGEHPPPHPRAHRPDRTRARLGATRPRLGDAAAAAVTRRRGADTHARRAAQVERRRRRRRRARCTGRLARRAHAHHARATRAGGRSTRAPLGSRTTPPAAQCRRPARRTCAARTRCRRRMRRRDRRMASRRAAGGGTTGGWGGCGTPAARGGGPQGAPDHGVVHAPLFNRGAPKGTTAPTWRLSGDERLRRAPPRGGAHQVPARLNATRDAFGDAAAAADGPLDGDSQRRAVENAGAPTPAAVGAARRAAILPRRHAPIPARQRGARRAHAPPGNTQ